MIPYLTTMTQQTSASEPTLSSMTPTITTSTETWKTPSTDSEHLLSTTTTTTATTTTTTAAAATETTDSALKVLLTSWTSTLKNGLENMTEIPATGEDVAVDVGGGGGGLHTPLNAPQPSLESVTLPPSSSSSSSFGRAGDLSELGWIIPISVISLVLMVVLALALYYGVRKLELRMLSWCYRNCGCCCAPGGGRGGRVLRGEQYDTLSEETGRKETVRLRDFREGSPSYGMTRKMSKEYSPPPRQPSPSFDDGDS